MSLSSRASFRLLFTIITIFAVIVFLNSAHAQTLDFTAKQTSGIGSLIPQFDWATTPPAKSCAASGSGSWSGVKPAFGSAALGPITSNKTYNMACYWDKVYKPITVTWKAPTKYMDGNPLPGVASYVITLKPSNVSATVAGGQLTASLMPTSAAVQTAEVVAVTAGSARSDPATSNPVTPKARSSSVEKSVRLLVSPKT